MKSVSTFCVCAGSSENLDLVKVVIFRHKLPSCFYKMLTDYYLSIYSAALIGIPALNHQTWTEGLY